MGVPRSRLRSAAIILAVVAGALAAEATVSIAVALIPAAQSLALTLMTNLLTAATVILAASLILSTVVSCELGTRPVHPSDSPLLWPLPLLR